MHLLGVLCDLCANPFSRRAFGNPRLSETSAANHPLRLSLSKPGRTAPHRMTAPAISARPFHPVSTRL